MSFLQKYLGDYSSGVANGDLANLANLSNETGANKPNSTNILSQVPRMAPPSAAAVQRTARRQRVLQMMAEDDQPRKYYWATDDKAHPDFVFLTLAIRDVGTCEMSIPKEKYDPFLLMEILDQHDRNGVDS